MTPYTYTTMIDSTRIDSCGFWLGQLLGFGACRIWNMTDIITLQVW